MISKSIFYKLSRTITTKLAFFTYHQLKYRLSNYSALLQAGCLIRVSFHLGFHVKSETTAIKLHFAGQSIYVM